VFRKGTLRPDGTLELSPDVLAEAVADGEPAYVSGNVASGKLHPEKAHTFTACKINPDGSVVPGGDFARVGRLGPDGKVHPDAMEVCNEEPVFVKQGVKPDGTVDPNGAVVFRAGKIKPDGSIEPGEPPFLQSKMLPAPAPGTLVPGSSVFRKGKLKPDGTLDMAPDVFADCTAAGEPAFVSGTCSPEGKLKTDPTAVFRAGKPHPDGTIDPGADFRRMGVVGPDGVVQPDDAGEPVFVRSTVKPDGTIEPKANHVFRQGARRPDGSLDPGPGPFSMSAVPEPETLTPGTAVFRKAKLKPDGRLEMTPDLFQECTADSAPAFVAGKVDPEGKVGANKADVVRAGQPKPDGTVEPGADFQHIGVVGPDGVMKPDGEPVYLATALRPNGTVDSNPVPGNGVFRKGKLRPDGSLAPGTELFDGHKIKPQGVFQPTNEVFRKGTLRPDGSVEPTQEVLQGGVVDGVPAFQAGTVRPDGKIEPTGDYFKRGQKHDDAAQVGSEFLPLGRTGPDGRLVVGDFENGDAEGLTGGSGAGGPSEGKFEPGPNVYQSATLRPDGTLEPTPEVYQEGRLRSRRKMEVGTPMFVKGELVGREDPKFDQGREVYRPGKVSPDGVQLGLDEFSEGRIPEPKEGEFIGGPTLFRCGRKKRDGKFEPNDEVFQKGVFKPSKPCPKDEPLFQKGHLDSDGVVEPELDVFRQGSAKPDGTMDLGEPKFVANQIRPDGVFDAAPTVFRKCGRGGDGKLQPSDDVLQLGKLRPVEGSADKVAPGSVVFHALKKGPLGSLEPTPDILRQAGVAPVAVSSDGTPLPLAAGPKGLRKGLRRPDGTASDPAPGSVQKGVPAFAGGRVVPDGVFEPSGVVFRAAKVRPDGTLEEGPGVFSKGKMMPADLPADAETLEPGMAVFQQGTVGKGNKVIASPEVFTQGSVDLDCAAAQGPAQFELAKLKGSASGSKVSPDGKVEPGDGWLLGFAPAEGEFEAGATVFRAGKIAPDGTLVPEPEAYQTGRLKPKKKVTFADAEVFLVSNVGPDGALEPSTDLVKRGAVRPDGGILFSPELFNEGRVTPEGRFIGGGTSFVLGRVTPDNGFQCGSTAPDGTFVPAGPLGPDGLPTGAFTPDGVLQPGSDVFRQGRVKPANPAKPGEPVFVKGKSDPAGGNIVPSKDVFRQGKLRPDGTVDPGEPLFAQGRASPEDAAAFTPAANGTVFRRGVVHSDGTIAPEPEVFREGTVPTADGGKRRAFQKGQVDDHGGVEYEAEVYIAGVAPGDGTVQEGSEFLCHGRLRESDGTLEDGFPAFRKGKLRPNGTIEESVPAIVYAMAAAMPSPEAGSVPEVGKFQAPGSDFGRVGKINPNGAVDEGIDLFRKASISPDGTLTAGPELFVKARIRDGAAAEPGADFFRVGSARPDGVVDPGSDVLVQGKLQKDGTVVDSPDVFALALPHSDAMRGPGSDMAPVGKLRPDGKIDEGVPAFRSGKVNPNGTVTPGDDYFAAGARRPDGSAEPGSDFAHVGRVMPNGAVEEGTTVFRSGRLRPDRTLEQGPDFFANCVTGQSGSEFEHVGRLREDGTIDEGATVFRAGRLLPDGSIEPGLDLFKQGSAGASGEAEPGADFLRAGRVGPDGKVDESSVAFRKGKLRPDGTVEPGTELFSRGGVQPGGEIEPGSDFIKSGRINEEEKVVPGVSLFRKGKLGPDGKLHPTNEFIAKATVGPNGKRDPGSDLFRRGILGPDGKVIEGDACYQAGVIPTDGPIQFDEQRVFRAARVLPDGRVEDGSKFFRQGLIGPDGKLEDNSKLAANRKLELESKVNGEADSKLRRLQEEEREAMEELQGVFEGRRGKLRETVLDLLREAAQRNAASKAPPPVAVVAPAPMPPPRRAVAKDRMSKAEEEEAKRLEEEWRQAEEERLALERERERQRREAERMADEERQIALKKARELEEMLAEMMRKETEAKLEEERVRAEQMRREQEEREAEIERMRMEEEREAKRMEEKRRRIEEEKRQILEREEMAQMDEARRHAEQLERAQQAALKAADDEKRKAEESQQVEQKSQFRYTKILQDAQKDDFSDLDKMAFLTLLRRDLRGRPVMLFTMSKYPQRMRTDAEWHQRLLKYWAWKTAPIVRVPYSVVIDNTGHNGESRPPMDWFKEAYGCLPRAIRKNMDGMYIVAAPAWVRAFAWMLRGVVSPKVWNKVQFISSLYRLYGIVDFRDKDMPRNVLQLSNTRPQGFFAMVCAVVCRSRIMGMDDVALCYEYFKAYDRGDVQDNSEFDGMKLLDTKGRDIVGRRVMLILGKSFDAERGDDYLERAFCYFVRRCDELVDEDYVVVYCNTDSGPENRPNFKWLKACYDRLLLKYKKNVKAVYILHGSFWLKSFSWFLKPFVSEKFWSKLIYIDSVIELARYFDLNTFNLPASVLSQIPFGGSEEELAALAAQVKSAMVRSDQLKLDVLSGKVAGAKNAAVTDEQLVEAQKAALDDFRDIRNLQEMVFYAGRDRNGLPLIAFMSKHLPANEELKMNRVFQYLVKLLEPLKDKPYAVCLCNQSIKKENRPDVSWLQSMYNTLTKAHRKNLKQCYIFYPSFALKSMAALLKTFVSDKFWKKVHYIEDFGDVKEFFDTDKPLGLPQEVLQGIPGAGALQTTSTIASGASAGAASGRPGAASSAAARSAPKPKSRDEAWLEKKQNKAEEEETPEDLDFVRIAGRDLQDRPAVVIVCENLSRDVDVRKCTEHLKTVLRPIVGQEYVVIVCNAMATLEHRPPMKAMRDAYHLIPADYRRNCHKVYVVHPTVDTRMAMWYMRTFANKKIMRELQYVDDVADLNPYFNLDQISLPNSTLDFLSKVDQSKALVSLSKQAQGQEMKRAAAKKMRADIGEEVISKSKALGSSALHEMESLGFAHLAGKDHSGQRTLVIIGSKVPASSDPQQMEKLLMYLVSLVDQISTDGYTVLYCNTNCQAKNRPQFDWMKAAYDQLPRRFKKNIKSLYVLHPNFALKSLTFFFKTFLSPKFWDKVTNVESVDELSQYMPVEKLGLPDEVLSKLPVGKTGKGFAPREATATH